MPNIFKELDPILHSQLRLGIISVLINLEEANFSQIKEKTNATAGNLSIQINKLKKAAYIEVEKKFSNNYPQTICRITHKGKDAFKKYEEALQSYFKPIEE
jgi:DNA-binding MarR family transcriptional regulator